MSLFRLDKVMSNHGVEHLVPNVDAMTVKKRDNRLNIVTDNSFRGIGEQRVKSVGKRTGRDNGRRNKISLVLLETERDTIDFV